MIRVLVATSMLVACGGGQPAPAKPPPAHVAEGSAHTEPPPSAPATPTAAECDQLLDHMIDLEFQRAANGTPAEQMPDPKQKAAIREQTGAQFRAECLKMPRHRLACAMAATTIETIAACDDQARNQARPSSSTSNSSVAFGGITPPAPRAP